MLLYEPGATPLDVNFRVFGTDVRVSPWFWLWMAILGWWSFESPTLPGNGILDVTLWVLCCFVSVLLHELGHVWMGRLFGTHGHILLHGMGGLAIGASALSRRWQRMLVIAAGPVIQLVFFGFLVSMIVAGGLMGLDSKTNPALTRALFMLLGINLIWPILNLLPIWPLDGGQLCMETCKAVSERQGGVVALWISVFVSGFLAINAFLVQAGKGSLIPIPIVSIIFGGLFMALFFAMFAYGSWQALQEETASRRRFWDDNLPWER